MTCESVNHVECKDSFLANKQIYIMLRLRFRSIYFCVEKCEKNRIMLNAILAFHYNYNFIHSESDNAQFLYTKINKKFLRSTIMTL